jgi:hypothetical protein
MKSSHVAFLTERNNRELTSLITMFSRQQANISGAIFSSTSHYITSCLCHIPISGNQRSLKKLYF